MKQKCANPFSVLFVFEQFKSGGFETHLNTLIRALARGGTEIYCVSGPDFSRSPERTTVSGYTHADFQAFSGATVEYAARLIADVIRRRKIQFVHTQPFLSMVPAALGSLVAGVPYGVTFHGPPNTAFAGYFGGLFLEALARFVLPHASVITAVSEEARDAVSEVFGVAAGRIHVIRNPVDLEEFSGQTARPEAGDSPVALFVSRLDDDKERGAIAALEFFRALRRLRPEWRFRVAGEGNREAALKARAEAEGLEDIEWLGHRDEIARLMAESRLVVGMGRVALEAIASRRMAVLAGCDGLVGLIEPQNFPELQRLNFGGRRQPQADPALLARRAEEALRSNRYPYDALRSLIAEGHDASQIAETHQRLYRSALADWQRPDEALRSECAEILAWLRSVGPKSLRSLEWLAATSPAPRALRGSPAETAAHLQAQMAFEQERQAWSGQIAEASNRSAQLSRELETLAAHSSALASQVDELSARNRQLAQELERVSAHSAGLATQVEELSAAKGQLAQEVETLSTRNAGLGAQVQELSGRLVELAGTASKQREQIESLTREILRLQSELAQSIQERAKLQQSAQDRAEALQQEIRRLQGELSEAVRQRDALQQSSREDIDRLRQEVQRLKGEVADGEQERSRMQSSAEECIDRLRQEVQRLKGEVADGEQERSRMQSSAEECIEQLRRQVQSLRDELTNGAEERSRLEWSSEEQICWLREEARRLQAELSDAVQQSIRLQKESHERGEELQRELERLRAQLSGVAEERGRLQQRAQELNSLASGLQAQCREYEVREQTLQAELDSARASCRALEVALHNARPAVVLRRGLHNVLDLAQSATPESVRAAIRPMYLRFYRRFFPHGTREFAEPVSAAVVRQPALPPPAAPAAPSGSDSEEPANAGPEGQSSEPAPVSDFTAIYPAYRPRVSVILPVWNHARFLGSAVQSVLDQTYDNIELIVVDDGSTDHPEEVMQRFACDARVKFVPKAHEGIAKALSAGFRAATGDFLTWTSADNLMHPTMVERLLDFMLRHPELDMTYGDMDLIGDDGAPLAGSDYRVSAQRPEASHKLRLPRTVETLGLLDDNFIGACFLYRSRIARIVGDYDSALLGTEDYDYWLRINELGTLRHVDYDDTLYSYRVHADTLSAKHGAKEIAPNAVQLIEYHRERTEYYRAPFDVVLFYEPSPLVPEAAVRSLARAFRAQGHSVSLVAPEGVELRIGPGITRLSCDLTDAAEVVNRLGKGEAGAKRLAVSFVDRPGFLEELAAAWSGETAFFSQWLPPLPKVRLPAIPDKPAWLLCGSSAHVSRLPMELARNWSLLVLSEVAFSEKPALALKARDNVFPLWDFPNVKQPLIVYLGPIREQVLDFGLIGEALGRYPDYDFLFIDTSEGGLDPRSRFPEAANLHWLGVKRWLEWHKYLSRAALLIAPFARSAGAEGAIQDALVTYLAAGKPVLATEAVASAGFGDMPNALVCERDAFAGSLERALGIRPDFGVADEYLRTRSPEYLVRALVSAANNRLYYRMTREKPAPPRIPGPRRGGGYSILLETQTLHRGGLERVVANMAASLRSQGNSVAIAVIQQDGDIGAECRSAGVGVYAIGGNASCYRDCLRAVKPDLVISHYSTFGAPLASECGVPVLDVIHNSYIWHGPEDHRRIREAAPFVTRYIAVSESARRFFSRKYGVEPSRIIPVPNGIDLEFHRKAVETPPVVTRASLGIGDDEFVFLQVASFFGTKAQAHSVSAMARLVEKCPRARLVLLGSKGDLVYYSFIKEQIARRGLENHVLCCGETDRVADYYRMADGFILSSLTEGWSLAKTEAMFYGLPLILTRVGGAEEVIEGDDIGLLAPPAYEDPLCVSASNLWALCTETRPPNLGALVSAMARFCAERELWRERGKAGREKVIKCYNSEITACRYAGVIQELVEGVGNRLMEPLAARGGGEDRER